MGSCAAPSAKGDDKFITTDYLQQCPDVCYCCFSKAESTKILTSHIFSRILLVVFFPFFRQVITVNDYISFFNPPCGINMFTR
ncbi:hypothetical protein CI660_26405 [Klebsiella pneumoniae]|nr:hypothetical protein CI660_26405 [Klebsiella pneumoniae]